MIKNIYFFIHRHRHQKIRKYAQCPTQKMIQVAPFVSNRPKDFFSLLLLVISSLALVISPSSASPLFPRSSYPCPLSLSALTRLAQEPCPLACPPPAHAVQTCACCLRTGLPQTRGIAGCCVSVILFALERLLWVLARIIGSCALWPLRGRGGQSLVG